MRILLLIAICFQLSLAFRFLSNGLSRKITTLHAQHIVPSSPQSSFHEHLRLGIASSAAIAYLSVPIVANAEEGIAGEKKFKGKSQFEYQPALQGLDYGKPRTYYPDFTQKPSGLQFKVVKEGTGKSPQKGDRVAVDWEGYTIGYYGRPFQTRNKVKGGAFDADQAELLRWTVGSGAIIAAIDEGVKYMKEGGVTQFIVPAEIGYPAGDPDHTYVGPQPTTFSGKRALNFVLDNQNLIDKTLLINIRLVKVAGPKDKSSL